MAQFPTLGGWGRSTAAEASEAGQPKASELDRATLRSDYEVALRAQAEGRHGDAVAILSILLVSLPSSGGRDGAWLQRFRHLCLRSMALCYRCLDQAAPALDCYRRALGASSLCGEEENSLWRPAAECAEKAEDWQAARLCFEHCAELWPEDPAVLRGLAKAVLHLGDLDACRMALEKLGSGECASLRPREAWLLQHLATTARKRTAPPRSSQDAPPPGALADYDALGQRRAKRLRSEATAPPLGAERLRLSAVTSLGEVVLAVHGFALRCPSPSQSLLFELGGDTVRGSETQSQLGPTVAEGALATAMPERSRIEEAWSCAWRTLRPLLVSPWSEKEGAVRWAVACLESPVAGTDAARSCGAEEILGDTLGETGLSCLLEIEAPETASTEASRLSPERPWREWLRRILAHALTHRGLLQRRRDAPLLMQALVELTVSLVLLARPKQHSSMVGRETLRDGAWASPVCLRWLSLPPQAGEAEDSLRLEVQRLLQTHGLELAEACAAIRARAPSLAAVGLGFLQAWRCCQSAGTDAWLQSLDSKTVPGASDDLWKDGRASALVVRYLWAWASLAAADEAPSFLRLCQQAAQARQVASGEAATQSSTGDTITASRCASRLETSVRPPEEVEELGRKRALGIETLGVEDFMDLVQHRVLTLSLPPPSQVLPSSDCSVLNVFWKAAQELVNRLASDGAGAEAEARLLLEALAALLGQLVVGISKLAVELREVGSHHVQILVSVLKVTTDLLAVLDRRSDAIACTSMATAPLLCGVASPDEGDSAAIFLAPPLERILIASLLLASEVSRTGFRDWFPLAQAALCLSVKVLGNILYATGAPPATRGGVLLLQRRKVKSGAMTTPRDLWLSMSAFLCAAHDIGLLLPECFCRGQSTGLGTETAASLAEKLLLRPRRLSDVDGRLCSTSEAPLSLPHLLLGCTLRVHCETVAQWREAWVQWLGEHTPPQVASPRQPRAPGPASSPGGELGGDRAAYFVIFMRPCSVFMNLFELRSIDLPDRWPNVI